MGILAQKMTRLARQAGGSHKTARSRIALAQRFCERLVMVQNVQIRRVGHLKVRHIEGCIRERLAQDISRRSLQNKMTAVRCILKQAGCGKLTQNKRLDSRSLGLLGISCEGTKQAIAVGCYHHVVEMIRARDPGMTAALELSRLMGLRSQETVQSVQLLKIW